MKKDRKLLMAHVIPTSKKQHDWDLYFLRLAREVSKKWKNILINITKIAIVQHVEHEEEIILSIKKIVNVHFVKINEESFLPQKLGKEWV